MISISSRISGIVAVAALALMASACGNQKHDEQAHAASGSAHHATPPAGASAPKTHGSHDPAHGGMVLMDGHEHHAELVLDPAGGAHRVYVSDGARNPLPASTFDEVTLTITRAG